MDALTTVINTEINKQYKNVKQFAEDVDIAYTTIKTALSKGFGGTSVNTVIKICSTLGIDLNNYIDCATTDNDDIILDKYEKEMIDKYRCLETHDKKLVDEVLNVTYEKSILKERIATFEMTKEREKSTAKSAKKAAPSYTPVQRHYPEGVIPLDSYHESDEYNDKITLPIYDAGASAGTGVFLDSTNYETAAMPNTHLTQRANFAVWVEGDSMEPRFHNGDLVLVRTQPAVDIGEIGIFVVNGEGFIKKLGENKLISLNPDYDDIELNEYDEVYCKGKVLGNA